MTVSITLRPSGRTFALEAGETILECALRAGLSLAHGCTNGSCGECQAKVLSGEVSETRFHDFVISETDKHAGFTLLCSTTAHSDLEIEAAHSASADDIALQSHRARVTRVEHLGPDMIALHCRIQRGRVMRFLAGQRARVSLSGRQPVDLPIASCPCDGHYLRFHIERDAGSDFAEQVFAGLRRAERVQVDGPHGRFVLDEDARRPLVFIAIGAGFAPIGSLVEHAISLELPQPMRLYWYAVEQGGHYLHNYCRAWADALDEFHYAPLAPEPAGEALDKGLPVAVQRIAGDDGHLARSDIYLAGPGALVERARADLAARGAHRHRMFSDAL